MMEGGGDRKRKLQLVASSSFQEEEEEESMGPEMEDEEEKMDKFYALVRNFKQSHLMLNNNKDMINTIKPAPAPTNTNQVLQVNNKMIKMTTKPPGVHLALAPTTSTGHPPWDPSSTSKMLSFGRTQIEPDQKIGPSTPLTTKLPAAALLLKQATNSTSSASQNQLQATATGALPLKLEDHTTPTIKQGLDLNLSL